MKEFRNPDDIHRPVGAYSHQIEIREERLLVISGQVGMRLDGTIPEDPYEQIDVAFENIFKCSCAAAGDRFRDMRPDRGVRRYWASGKRKPHESGIGTDDYSV